jgi:proteasome beta subunit
VNRLAAMIRTNLGAALQGLAALPIYAGFDLAATDPAKAGRIFTFDIAGSLNEVTDFDGLGSGSVFAKSALKKRYRPGLPVADAIRLSVEALYDAADDDIATGGPDLTRKIYPVVMTATAGGVRRLSETEAAEVAEAVVAARMENPAG